MTIDGPRRERIMRIVLELIRGIAAESCTGHLGSEHVGLLAVRGTGGLAELTGVPAERLTEALRRECDLAAAIPPDRPTLTPRTARLVRTAIELAEMRGLSAPTAAELVGALLNEPGCEAWKDLAVVGVTEALVERAQRDAFAAAPRPPRTSPPPAAAGRREGD
jgi:hypothetical protein